MRPENIAHHGGVELLPVVLLLGAAVIAVPLFKRLGLGSVTGYLAAGIAVGPYGFGVVTDLHAILQTAELGVVLFLFVIGLEMRPSRLWTMRGDIFGLGLAQVAVAGAVLAGVGVALGYPAAASFVAGSGFVLTSTAIVMQMLEERQVRGLPRGRRTIAILLLEDMAIVPLLAIVALLAPGPSAGTAPLESLLAGFASLAALVLVGRYLLDPLFRLLGGTHTREVMAAAALLVVLGAALAMQLGGLSMAMGAFVAGVLLSESAFRHQLEADIEPFRGILLGLFFLGVGMALDLAVIAAHWQAVAAIVFACMTLKMAAIYVVARAFRLDRREAVGRAVLMAQGGEFAFVLYAAAAAAGIIDAATNAMLTTAVIASMALTPFLVMAYDRFMPKTAPPAPGAAPAPAPDAAVDALLIGFGRFGQIVSQPLLAAGHAVSIIETSTQAIFDLEPLGFKVHYGDGSRLDILLAAGARDARVIIVAVDDRTACLRIVELARSEFPETPVLARAYDREHALQLIHADAHWHIRETLESALGMGEKALQMLGAERAARRRVMADVRRRDAERLAIQVTDGLYAAPGLVRNNSAQNL